MKIANGVEMLELTMNIMGNQSTIHPTLIFDDQNAILVDVGMPGQLQDIEAALAKAGIRLNQLTGVILTHQDIDHIGSIQEVLAAVGKPIPVYAHKADKPYIEGDKEPIKMTKERVAQMVANLPEDVKKQVEAVFLNPPTAKVTDVIQEGDILPICGGITVIFTPGHTPGHVSLFHNPSQTLITGDATVSENGKILGPNPQATPDMAEALESQNKFLDFDIRQAICYHGGLCTEDVNGQFQALAQNQA